jgi:Flp pilus assembly protein TadG
MFALIALVIIVGVTAFGAPVKEIVECELPSVERRGQMVIAQQLPQTSRRRHKGHLDRGAAAVEMALVLPVLLFLLMGIIDFGRMFNAQIQLSQAAREGVRLASLNTGATLAAMQSDLNPNGDKAIALRVTSASAALPGTFAASCSAPTAESSSACITYCPIPSLVTPSSTATVVVTAHFTAVTGVTNFFGFTTFPTTLSSTGVMGCAG